MDKCPNLTSLTPFFKGSDVPINVGLYWCMGSVLARCPSCCHQWLTWVPAWVESMLAGCKSVVLTIKLRLFLSQLLYITIYVVVVVEERSVRDPCPWFWIFIYRNGHVKILWLIDWLLFQHCNMNSECICYSVYNRKARNKLLLLLLAVTTTTTTTTTTDDGDDYDYYY